MARKRIGQLGWGDAAISRRRKQRRDRLTEIAALLDWRPFEALLSEIHSSRRGEPSYPPLAMFKVLLLQRWYDLSDQIGRAHVCTPVTNAHLVCRRLLENNQHTVRQ